MKKIILFSLFALSLINATAQDSLVVFYKLNYLNNTQDISGNNHNAYVQGNSLLLTTDNCGIDSSASIFDTSAVVSDSAITTNLSSGHTISMWLKFYPFIDSGVIMSYGNIKIFYNSFKITYTNGVDTLNIANPLPTQWDWFNYTIINDNFTIKAQTKLYNGVTYMTSTSNTNTLYNFSDTLKVGSTTEFINNNMYNFAFFDKALTYTQIDTLVSDCVSHVGVNNIATIDEKIYPNPANDYIYCNTKTDMYLLNMNGDILIHGVDRLNVSNIESGVYILLNDNDRKLISISH